MMIRAIIYDLEGVIIDTEKLWDIESHELFDSLGLRYDKDEIKHLVSGREVGEVTKIILKHYMIKTDPDEITRKRVECMKSLINKDLRFIKGFKESFVYIQDRFKVAVATAMTPQLLSLVDQKIHLSRMFNSHIYSISQVNNIAKPKPDIFLLAAKKLRVKPKDCAVIEDSPLGIQAANKAGMMSIGITTTYRKELLKDADVVIDDFNALIRFLDEN